MISNDEYLFIAGCARSGTSALAQLIGASDNVTMGMERYGHLVAPDDFKLTPDHFLRERFLNIEEDDTFYSDFKAFHSFDENIESKAGHTKYIGDKRPDLYESYDLLFNKFPKAKLLFIYRDIEEVASSYQARVKKGDNWPSSKDYRRAVVEWNRSLYLTREALAKGYDIKVVSYSQIFSEKIDLQPLFEWLDIEIDHRMWRKMVDIDKRAQKLQSNRVLLLTTEEIKYINDNAKYGLVDDLSQSMLLCSDSA